MQSVRPATLGPASVLVAALVVGCLPSIPPVPDDALETLRRQGHGFRASEAPPGATRPAVLLDHLRRTGRLPPAASQQPLGPATYGVMSCERPGGCNKDQVGVWVISFPGLGPMAVSWIIIDADEGQVIESGGR